MAAHILILILQNSNDYFKDFSAVLHFFSTQNSSAKFSIILGFLKLTFLFIFTILLWNILNQRLVSKKSQKATWKHLFFNFVCYTEELFTLLHIFTFPTV